MIKHKASSNLYGNKGIERSDSKTMTQICWVTPSFSIKQETLGRTDSLKSNKLPMDIMELMPFPPQKKKFIQLVRYDNISQNCPYK